MLLFFSMKTEIDTRFFRAGVGTVIYNQAGRVAIFERSQYPVGVWQFQQGGIDLEEDTQTTLWRELSEETGLVKEDMELVTEYPVWTVYQDVNSVHDSSKSRLGQAHRWYFLKLKDTVYIDLSQATEIEASDFKWVSFDEAIAKTEELKKHVYRELETYFKEVILRER
jgi:putative (di)nucleoside polyphosphate hydrolase